MKMTYYMLAAILLAAPATAQEEKKEKNSVTIEIEPDGIRFNSNAEKNKNEKAFDVDFLMMDFGFNSLGDKTNYAAAEAKNFLGSVPDINQNENLFSLRAAKSINVNIWPVMASWRLLKTSHQKAYLSFGVGLQMYNFRFTKDISYAAEPNPGVGIDSISFSKNKLGFTYAAVPLMLTFKTKLAKKAWLVYGAGITGGYRVDSWTKQISKERGKDKNHDKFNFKDFNSCLTAEIGLEHYFRLYATYQLTPLHDYALIQHPLCIGLRFGGV